MEKINSDLPKIKIKEKDEEIIVKIYISGINEKDIELEIKEDFLKVDVNKTSEEAKRGRGWSAKGWETSSFSGKISLPSKVIPILIHHKYNGRVLEIKLKKS